LLFFGPDADLIHRAADHFVGAVAGQAAEAVVDLQIAAGVAFGDGDGVGAEWNALANFSSLALSAASERCCWVMSRRVVTMQAGRRR
jgi:hypothetical protein